MTQYGISLQQLRQAMADFHAEVPAGSFNTGQFDRTVRNEAKFRGVDDIREAIVSSAEGRIIRVRDIAEVIDTHRRVKNVARLNGKECATIVINKESNINTLGAARAVKAKVAELQRHYPHLEFSTTRDTSLEIWVMFRVLGSSALFGAMLVLVILAWTMGLRISILVLMAIPFSTAVALVFLYATGVPISNMVVFSFILVLGMVVDGAIIVAENIHRHIERGEDPVDAAKIGIEEVGVPVIAADLTTIAAYLPMLLVPGIMGDFLGTMPKVVTMALIGSILVDHFLIPALAARWYGRRRVKRPTESDAQVSAYVRPNLGFFTRGYAAALRFALANRFVVLIWCCIAVWGAGILYRQIGFKFFPPSDRGQFTVNFELPLGYSIDETVAASKRVTDPLKDWESTGILDSYVTSAGTSQGLSTRLDDDPVNGPEFGQVMVELLPPMDRTINQQEVIDDLRRRIKPLPGMKIRIVEAQDGPPGGAPVAVRLTGDDLDQLGKLGETISAHLSTIAGTVDATTDYRPDSPQLVVEPKPDVVGLFGLTDMQIARAVQTAIAGDTSIQVTLDDEDVNLRLQLAPEYQQYPADLKRLMITSPTGQRASIGQLADIRRDMDLYAINRYERNRAVVAKCKVDDDTTPADVFAQLSEEVLPELGFVAPAGVERSIEGIPKTYLGTTTTPSEGVKAEFVGENDERDKTFHDLVISMVLAVVLIFAILIVQFNSLRQSIVVMVTVPLSFIGVVLGMWACGFPFSLASFIGLVSLTGIVVNDAIVLVDFTNQARRRGMPVREAIMEAGINRLRPVLLTTITTIGGLLPLLLNVTGGAEFWQPLTGAIVFGLSFATVLTLIVIPVCYSLAYSFARE
jgi:HAE1 family hydrophobic/amphiphilic exporter-1